MEKPNPKLYGWQDPTSDDPGGWMLEGGEEAYSNALSAYFESLDTGFNDHNGPGESTMIEPFFCLDEGDGKPRCQVQCPFCERV